MIVFAGGPHTPERTALACELLTSHPPPSVIYLTGAEYQGEYSNLAARVRSIAASLPTHPEVRTDDCHTTWASCRYLTRQLTSPPPPPPSPSPKIPSKEGPGVGSSPCPPLSPPPKIPSKEGPGVGSSPCLPLLRIITSNYHAPRVNWLFTACLRTPHPSHFTSNISHLTILTTPDIPWRKALATSRNRHLIIGECISWLYCGPLGLLCRPLWLVGLGLLGLGGYVARRLHHPPSLKSYGAAWKERMKVEL